MQGAFGVVHWDHILSLYITSSTRGNKNISSLYMSCTIRTFIKSLLHFHKPLREDTYSADNFWLRLPSSLRWQRRREGGKKGVGGEKERDEEEGWKKRQEERNSMERVRDKRTERKTMNNHTEQQERKT